jgi:hypothetical protein
LIEFEIRIPCLSRFINLKSVKKDQPLLSVRIIQDGFKIIKPDA